MFASTANLRVQRLVNRPAPVERDRRLGSPVGVAVGRGDEAARALQQVPREVVSVESDDPRWLEPPQRLSVLVQRRVRAVLGPLRDHQRRRGGQHFVARRAVQDVVDRMEAAPLGVPSIERLADPIVEDAALARIHAVGEGLPAQLVVGVAHDRIAARVV